MTATRYRYSWVEPGFFRLSPCGFRCVVIDTKRSRPCYSDRTHGMRLGRFLIRISRESA